MVFFFLFFLTRDDGEFSIFGSWSLLMGNGFNFPINLNLFIDFFFKVIYKTKHDYKIINIYFVYYQGGGIKKQVVN